MNDAHEPPGLRLDEETAPARGGPWIAGHGSDIDGIRAVRGYAARVAHDPDDIGAVDLR